MNHFHAFESAKCQLRIETDSFRETGLDAVLDNRQTMYF